MNISLETKIFLGISIGTLLFVGLIAVFLGRGTPSSSSSASVSTQTLVPINSHSIGPADAKVTIIEFSDFECPACKVAQPTVTQILQKYKDRIRFVYRNFPLPSHEFGMVAAQAAESAGLQGKFWEMHDKLFEKSPDLSKDKIINYAAEVGLDPAKFAADLDSDTVKSAITKDQDDGNAVGIEATPTFFINGTKFTGGLTLSQFEQEINSRLK